MMKKLAYLLTLLLFCSSLIAQNILSGFVKLQSSGKTPLANVEVYALGAQTTYTNDKGYFELKFSNKNAGDLIGYVEFSLEGYVLINEEKCEGLTIPKDPSLSPLQIVMSKKNAYREQKAQYYGIIINNANEAYEKQNKQLQERLASLESNDEERRVLLKQIDNLQQEKEQAIANAERYAQIFAKIDTDGASELGSQALELFKEGKIKEAIALMGDEQLRDNMKNAQAAKEEANSLALQADSMLQQCVENYMIKARLYTTDLQFGAAYKNYLHAIEGDSTNVDNLWELAYFCGELNQQKRAIGFYQQALRHHQSEETKAHLLNNLGHELRKNNQYKDAELAYLEALAIRKRLAKSNPEYFKPYIATTQNNLGILYKDLYEYKKAELAYREALALRKDLALSNPEHFEPEVAAIQYTLGFLYLTLDDYENAVSSFTEGLNIYNHLSESNPEINDPYIAIIQLTLGNIYFHELYDIIKSISFYDKANSTYDRLEELIHESYDPMIANAQYHRGESSERFRNLEEAKASYEKALTIYNRLARLIPERYDIEVARTLNSLGFAHYNLDAFEQAKMIFIEAQTILDRLAQSNPELYDSDMAQVKFNLGLIYADMDIFVESEMAYNEALVIYQQLAESNPYIYNRELAKTLLHLGYLHKASLEMFQDWSHRISGIDYAKQAKAMLSIYPTNISHIKKMLNEVNELISYFDNIAEEGLQVRVQINKAFSLDEKVETLTDPVQKLYYQEEVVNILEPLFQKYNENITIKNLLANAYDKLSGNQLFTRQFYASEQSARKSLKLNSCQGHVEVILFTAMLFQGKYKQSKALYFNLCDESYANGFYKEVILSLLKQLEEEGITHPDVEKIRALLQE
jgi:tetratricopeptide (TPR) repeat protein